jgi:group I intron endonuclease
MTYIYTLTDGNEIRYVGKTKFISKRYNSHINESKKKRTYKEKWINKTLLNGGKIIIEILDVCDDKNSNEIESYWISQLKCWGFNLLNLTSGGDGGTPMLGKKHTNLTKLKLSQIAKSQNRNIGGWNKGLKVPDEVKRKISKKCKGRILSVETKNKISEKLKGVKRGPMSDKTKLKISEKKTGSVSPNKGKIFNESVRKNMSLSKLGMKRSEEVKKKLSECKKIIWKIKTPDGDIMDFFGYNSFKDFVYENSLNVSITTLKSYGKNKGWEVTEKIKLK